jgi:hypothetical protein
VRARSLALKILTSAWSRNVTQRSRVDQESTEAQIEVIVAAVVVVEIV